MRTLEDNCFFCLFLSRRFCWKLCHVPAVCVRQYEFHKFCTIFPLPLYTPLPPPQYSEAMPNILNMNISCPGCNMSWPVWWTPVYSRSVNRSAFRIMAGGSRSDSLSYYPDHGREGRGQIHSPIIRIMIGSVKVRINLLLSVS